jgi:DNA-binding LacI/PurR family transcriptional regulator
MEEGLPFNPKWIHRHLIPFQSIVKKVMFGKRRAAYSIEDGFVTLGRAIAKEMKISVKNVPTGIVCVTDEIACSVREFCLKRQLIVPEDVAIVGCNDTLAPYVSMTSYRWDYDSYARQLLDHVIAQIEGGVLPVLKSVGGHLNKRDSTCRTGMAGFIRA